ncbi:hypothetical protein F4604DRAFT_1906185 [Suillus subluteus]|nr:hypothetical protein F4604DRAFT_1906185 [Suillus subluteus]
MQHLAESGLSKTNDNGIIDIHQQFANTTRNSQRPTIPISNLEISSGCTESSTSLRHAHDQTIGVKRSDLHVRNQTSNIFCGTPGCTRAQGGSEELGVEYPVSEESDLPLVVQEFPEGGLAAWSTAFGSFLILFCSLGYTSSFGVYRGIAEHENFYTEHYLTHETSFAISFIGSFNGFLGSTLSLISGSLYDRGYFYHLVITGSLLQSFSLLMLSLAKPNQYFQAQVSHWGCCTSRA